MATPATTSATATPSANATAASPTSSDSTTILTLTPLPTSRLPPHTSLNNTTSTVSPQTLALTLLNAGAAFHATNTPHFTPKGRPRTHPDSASPVEILSYTVPGSQTTWFARRSRHADRAEAGTATWGEFDHGIRAEHSRCEAEYTPEVIEGWQVCAWDVASGADDGWVDVGLEVYEMAHKMPPPLTNRFFAVLVATARAPGGDALLVVQVPVDLRDAPAAKFSAGKAGKLVQGAYVSVERVGREADGTLLWEMATASDARGVLPMGVQKLGIPGAIAKDVGLFLGWVGRRRRKEEEGGLVE